MARARQTRRTTATTGASVRAPRAAGGSTGPDERAARLEGQDGPDEQVAARLRVAVTRLHRRLRQESFAGAGISPSHESALGAISRLGSPTLGELAQAERVQPPTMTRVVAAMEAEALIVRRDDAQDRRVRRVELTRKGHATLERIRSLKTVYLARRLGQLVPAHRARAGELAALLEELVEDR